MQELCITLATPVDALRNLVNILQSERTEVFSLLHLVTGDVLAVQR